MNRIVPYLLSAALLVVLALPAGAEEGYRYIAPEKVKAMIEHGEPLHVLDIQVADQYADGHLPGAMKTCAYPVKSDADKARLDARMDELRADAAPIVIVCPRGKGGAKRTRDHLLTQGFDAERLLILEGGQQGWPYGEMTESD